MLMMICLTVSVGAWRLFHVISAFFFFPEESREERGSLDKTLVDAHLVLVPGLGTLTVGGLAGGDVQGLGRETDCYTALISLPFVQDNVKAVD
jgi:hypothetical protein